MAKSCRLDGGMQGLRLRFEAGGAGQEVLIDGGKGSEIEHSDDNGVPGSCGAISNSGENEYKRLRSEHNAPRPLEMSGTSCE